MDKPIPAALRDAIKHCLGSQQLLAEILGIKDRRVVNNWVARKKVPRYWYPQVLEVAKEWRAGR